uniref:Secreted protein n=1 Tax=Rhipicephalus appendiculatus TaxID=34631 RepID=A0A131YDI3_RHIAP
MFCWCAVWFLVVNQMNQAFSVRFYRGKSSKSHQKITAAFSCCSLSYPFQMSFSQSSSNSMKIYVPLCNLLQALLTSSVIEEKDKR